MGIEIERKFLVAGESWRQAEPHHFVQGYLTLDQQRTVRVRIDGERAFLTVKGISVGARRKEFEYAIPVDDARQLLGMCMGNIIEKWRHVVEHAGMRWEVDEFTGENAGLVVAEIELGSEDQAFERPAWVGKEVTADARYYNSNLAARPWRSWPR